MRRPRQSAAARRDAAATGDPRASTDRGRGRFIVAGLAVLMVVLLTLFAIELAKTQSSSRADVASKLGDRTQQTAALTAAILSTVTGSSATSAYDAANIDDAKLGALTAKSHLAYAALLDGTGNVLATTGAAQPVSGALAARSPWIERALRDDALGMSNLMPDAATGGVIALAAPFVGDGGQRVLVEGLPESSIAPFLSLFLSKVPVPESRVTDIVDGNGRVIATSDLHLTPGGPLPSASLRRALATGKSNGAYGNGGYYASAPVPGTPWRTLVTEPQSQVFATGTNASLDWLLFAAFGLAALTALVLLRRLFGSAASLRTANTGLSATNASLVSTKARLESTNADLESTNAGLESANALLMRNAELARSNAELEQFASIASHDLQEPLRKVQTFAAQLTTRESGRLSDEGKDYLRRMNVSAARMRTLIDDLLMFSRVNSSSRPFVAVDLDAVVSDVIFDLELTITETGARLDADPLPTIDADPLQMRQLFQNLLANALKFHREGVAPVVTIRSRETAGVVEITVADNGIGFDPKYSTRIFRAFERLHGINVYPGTGIGLALCRKIVERHLGTISAEGRPDAGATFTLALPLRQHESQRTQPLAAAADDGARGRD